MVINLEYQLNRVCNNIYLFSGEIKFNEDMDMPVGTLYGKFFQSTEANAKIDSIDSSQIHVSVWSIYVINSLKFVSFIY